MKCELNTDILISKGVCDYTGYIDWNRFKGIKFECQPNPEKPFYWIRVYFENSWQDFCREFLILINED